MAKITRKVEKFKVARIQNGVKVTVERQQVVVKRFDVLNVTQGMDAHYEHTQAVASATWVINHNLGKYPSVTIVDSGGNEWITDIEYNSLNQCTARFSAAFGGKAYCN